MTVKDAIEKIGGPAYGFTSVINAVINNDFSVLSPKKYIDEDLQIVQNKLKLLTQQQNECKSDWSYWQIEGDLAYWTSVKYILEAAQINNGILADVNPPSLNGVAMDVMSNIENYGKSVLEETRKINQQKQ